MHHQGRYEKQDRLFFYTDLQNPGASPSWVLCTFLALHFQKYVKELERFQRTAAVKTKGPYKHRLERAQDSSQHGRKLEEGIQLSLVQTARVDAKRHLQRNLHRCYWIKIANDQQKPGSHSFFKQPHLSFITERNYSMKTTLVGASKAFLILSHTVRENAGEGKKHHSPLHLALHLYLFQITLHKFFLCSVTYPR